MRLRRFRTRYLDLEFAADPRVRIRIVERPGRWMSAAGIDSLLADLRAVVTESVPGGTLDYGVFTGNPACLAQAIITILYDADDGRPVAFNALAVLPVTLGGREEHVLHFGLAMIAPRVRGRGLSWVSTASRSCSCSHTTSFARCGSATSPRCRASSGW